VSRPYRDRNCYRSEAGDWYEDEHNRDEANDSYYADAEVNADYIYSYHATTPFVVHGGWPTATPKNGLCFGVELEMENAASDSQSGGEDLAARLGGCAGSASFGDGRYILMSDGSLSASGVELITLPYTLEFHQAKFGWQKLLASIKSIGKSGAGTSNCGMHVHCNRKAISALNLGKLLVFVNSKANEELMKRIAQRDPEEWAAFHPKTIADGKQINGDKYEAVHLGRETIEFRIFRGNLRPDRVLKNIEFCHAAILYTRQASIKAINTTTDFIAWLGKNRKTYPNLVAFLAEGNFSKRMSSKNYPQPEEI
jgi:hypothetical protein